jgi:hypothetical protein
MTEFEQRAAVVAEAMRWTGTPFAMNCAIRGVGVDCARLAAAVYVECGLLSPLVLATLPHFAADWARHTSDEGYLRLVQQHLREVDAPLPGDMAIFKLERIWAHGAIIMQAWPTIMHVCRRGMRVSLADAHQEPLLKRRPVRFFSPFGA